jgi:hypothetical protein
MTRREFIALLGGATWPLTARAQQLEQMRRIVCSSIGTKRTSRDFRAMSATTGKPDIQ